MIEEAPDDGPNTKICDVIALGGVPLKPTEGHSKDLIQIDGFNKISIIDVIIEEFCKEEKYKPETIKYYRDDFSRVLYNFQEKYREKEPEYWVKKALKYNPRYNERGLIVFDITTPAETKYLERHFYTVNCMPKYIHGIGVAEVGPVLKNDNMHFRLANSIEPDVVINDLVLTDDHIINLINNRIKAAAKHKAYLLKTIPKKRFSRATSRAANGYTENKMVFLSGPYSTGENSIEENVRLARYYCNYIQEQGLSVYSPHAYHSFAQLDSLLYEDWMDICFDWIDACDIVFRIGGASEGADREVQYARQSGKEVIHKIGDIFYLR